jgi:hypothetical protein
MLPGELVAVYDIIGQPPLLAGAVNATVAVVCPVAVAVTIVGAPGTVPVFEVAFIVKMPPLTALTEIYFPILTQILI